jgi:hypothetical protein
MLTAVGRKEFCRVPRNPRPMSKVEVSRTLVKSPPELWTELSGTRLAEAVGGATVSVAEEERRIEWQAEGARGAAELEPTGWGTRLTLTAEFEDEVARLEPEVARLGFWARLRSTRPPAAAAPTPPRAHGLQRAFERLLDDLGSAHRRPFQQG